MKVSLIVKVVVCTDSGLSSATSRYFNTYDKKDGNRSFITTQSIKKLKSHLKKWALEPTGWYLSGSSSMTEYDIRELDDNDDKEKIFFKSRWIKEKTEIHEDGKTKVIELEQQLVVSYSIKYRDYLRSIRNGQIERAEKMIQNILLQQTTLPRMGKLQKKLSATSIRSGLTKRKNMTVFMLSAQIGKMNRKQSSK